MPPAALYKRWIAFGLLSSHSRLHGSSSYRVPWLFDEQAVDVLRFFTNLKCRLMPYLYAQAVEATRTGVPLMRAMLLEFPDDPACQALDRQYMLGEHLLVAPVFSEDGAVSYYVPAGRWTHLLTGAVVEGPGWVSEAHDALSLPLLVRPGAAIPVGARDDRPDYEYVEGVTLQVYALADGGRATAMIPTLAGAVDAMFSVTREGETIHVAREGPARPWRLVLVGVTSVGSAHGGTAESSTQGTLVTAEPGSAGLRITLDAFG
jgi:alpha-D-xyloside xylohydrolase